MSKSPLGIERQKETQQICDFVPQASDIERGPLASYEPLVTEDVHILLLWTSPLYQGLHKDVKFEVQCIYLILYNTDRSSSASFTARRHPCHNNSRKIEIQILP